MVCPGCQPAEDEPTEFVYPYGQVSRTLARYHRGCTTFHRGWCKSRVIAKSRPGIKTDPKDCDCGYDRPAPFTPAEIEKRENATYGKVTN
jgi:hypothetical protein